MSTFLTDGNVLIALTVANHVHHETAVTWFEGTDAHLATCPITEGTLLRFLLREGHTAGDAISVLGRDAYFVRWRSWNADTQRNSPNTIR